MGRCPVCEKEPVQGPVCEDCGFDFSCHYERNRTLCSARPKHAEPVSALAAKWKRRKQTATEPQRALVCPKCGGNRFSFLISLIDEPQFLCADCGEKIPVTLPKAGPVSENDSSVEHETTDSPDEPPVIEETDTLPGTDKTPEQKTAKEPSGSDGSGPGGPAPEPAGRTGQRDSGMLQGDSGMLLVSCWYCLVAAAVLVLMSWLTLDRGWSFQVAYVPGMLLYAVFYAVNAVFVFRCRRRIREISDAKLAYGVGRIAFFFGSLINLHTMRTIFSLLQTTYDSHFLSPMMLNAVFYVISVVFAFVFYRSYRELLGTGSAGHVRRTAVFFGRLILIGVLLDAINQFILWFVPNYLYPFD